MVNDLKEPEAYLSRFSLVWQAANFGYIVLPTSKKELVLVLAGK